MPVSWSKLRSMTPIVAFLHKNALSSYLKYADFVLDQNYLLSGATDIDGEWSDAGFNAGGKIRARLCKGYSRGIDRPL